MAENSKIEWCHHTFNPIRGCQKVSDGCKFCYAETLSKRNPATLGEWGPNGTRVVAAEAYWKQPVKWNEQATKYPYICEDCGATQSHCVYCQSCGNGNFQLNRPRVFCASLADVFEDRPEWIEARMRLFELIDATPHLDWLLLTKRPENIERLWPFGFYDEQFSWQNVWLGTSVENQATADERIPHLLKVPAKVRFLSCEPLLGAVDLTSISIEGQIDRGEYLGGELNALTGVESHPGVLWPFEIDLKSQIDWVICGGESGPNARPFQVSWARELNAQCEAADVPFFLKQLGSVVDGEGESLGDWPMGANFDTHRRISRIDLKDKKGGYMNEWPEDLRVRQVPEVD